MACGQHYLHIAGFGNNFIPFGHYPPRRCLNDFKYIILKKYLPLENKNNKK
jgi:hypothetical protein